LEVEKQNEEIRTVQAILEREKSNLA